MRCTPILCCCSLLLAAACRQAHPPPPTPLAADYTKAESLYNAQNDSAFYYFNKVAASATDSLQAAMAYSYMGIIQSAAGDYFGSQESLLASLKHLDETNTAHLNCLLSDYNELGRVSLNLKNYEDAITYDDKALQFTGDTVSRCIVLSNKAVAHQKKKQYRQALSIYDTILHQSLGQPKRYARILSNMAYTRWLQEPRHQAGSALLQALRMQDSLQDTWGRNASYAHLSAYYRDRQPDSALLYARQMYTVAQNLRSPDDELEALEKLLPLESPGAVRALFARYQSLNDSLQTSRNNAKNQFALIRYEVAKNKADNLVLQSENTDKKWQIRWQWALIISLILGSFALVAWLRKRRQRLLREQQLKTSQKVHDVVANGLYQLMRKIEYAAPGPGVVLDELEALYEQSRDISYDHLGELPADYSGSLATLLASFGSAQTSIAIVGNSPATWDSVAAGIKSELRYILRELMVNMQKHSGASSVVIRFERQQGWLTIKYSDDGKGLPEGFCYGNGLRNTENRIAGLRGTLSFDTAAPAGVTIHLSVPIP